MGLGYWRRGAVGLTASMVVAMGGVGAALAADPPSDVVTDGVVTVHWVDADDGPMPDAVIQIAWTHEGDGTLEDLPALTTDSAGNAEFAGVPRAADGSLPVLLNVRGIRSTTTTDTAGCTAVASWLAETDSLTSAAALEVSLVTSSKGLDMSCPEPDPGGNPAPGGDPEPGGDPAPDGGVLGATGKPQITLPPTDVAVAPGRAAPGTPILPTLLLVLGAGAIVLPITVRATVPVRRSRR